MRVFVTGATGFVGSAVVQELFGAGHEVVGLVRTPAAAEALAKTGAQLHHGSLEDLQSLRSGAAAADGVIHTAFSHDFTRFAENGAVERAAIAALGEALEGSDRPLIVTAGVAMLAPGRAATEADTSAASAHLPRSPEAAAAAAAERGVRTAVVRLAPSTHGHGDHGFVPRLIAIAREAGVSGYAGAGAHRWAAVHRFDAARLYRLALERGGADGPFHAIAEEGVAFKAIAETIGRGLDVPVKSMSQEEAAQHFGWFAMFAGMDMAASSERTRAILGWRPTGPGLLEDMEQAGYFAA